MNKFYCKKSILVVKDQIFWLLRYGRETHTKLQSTDISPSGFKTSVS